MTTTVLYAATEPFITRSTDTPANQQFSATLEATLRIDRSITGGQIGFGGFTESISELTLINADAEYDSLATGFTIDGQDIKCSIGQISANGLTVDPYAQFVRFALLAGERLRLDRARLTIEMRDQSVHMLVPVQDELYAGIGSTNGDATISGKRRPRAEGTIFNATATLVIPNDLVYQYNDGFASITSVKDGGVPLQFNADYVSVENMLTNASQIQPGSYATCKELGYFMLGGSNFFQVTCDIVGPRQTTAQILQWAAVRSANLQTLDADRVVADVTLSDGYKIATTSATLTVGPNVFSRTGYSAGKHCFRLAVGSVGIDMALGFSSEHKRSGFSQIGKEITSSVATKENPYAPGDSVAAYAAGTVFFSNAATGEAGNSFTTGSSVLLAVNVDTAKWWYKVGVGNWNNNVAADPATGVGGFDLHFTSGDFVFAAAMLNGAGASITFDFYPDTTTLPSGYSQWGAEPKFAVDYATFETLDDEQGAAIGYYLGQDESASFAEMFSALSAGIGGWFGFSPLGLLQVYRFSAPIQSSQFDYDTHGGDLLEIDRTSLPDSIDPPPQRVRVIYQRNYTVMTEIAGLITDTQPALADAFRNPHQLATTTDAEADTVLAIWPDAQDPNPIESYFAFLADAQNEADRLYALYSSGLYQCYRARLSNAIFVHEIGQIIKVTDTRFGLSTGKYLRIVSLNDDLSSMTTDVVGFG